MRLTAVLLTAAFVSVQATSLAQNVTLSGKNLSFKEIFSTIKKQTGYVAFLNEEVLAGTTPVSLTVREMPLPELLELVVKNQPLTYVIKDKTIFVSRKVPGPRDWLPSRVIPASVVRVRVTDGSGKPLAGASVAVKGSKISGITSSEGILDINVSEGNVLIVSYVGYEPRTIQITATILDNAVLDVQLRSSTAKLDEVTVVSTGYQTLPRERATGAFGSLDRRQLEKPSTNVAQRLIGTIAGMQSNLDADGTPSFEIRGKTSLYANARPLVVVDGFPLEGDFSTINPNIVESVTLLKDAAAASIWGARSANGVIVVTTKNSKRESLRVELNSFVRIGGKLDLGYVNPLASSVETIDFEKMAFNKWNGRTNSGSLANMDYLRAWSQASTALNEQHLGFITAQQRDNLLDQLAVNDNRQQIADNFLRNPVDQQYNLTISAGNQRSSHIFSFLFANSQSNFTDMKNKQFMINYRTATSVFKWLDVNFSGMLQQVNADSSGYGLDYIKSLSPYDMLQNGDGSYTNVINDLYLPALQRYVPQGSFPYKDWSFNPVREMNNRDIEGRAMNVRLQAGLIFKLAKGLTYEARGQYESFNTSMRNLYNEETYKVRSLVNTTSSWNQGTNVIKANLPSGSILDQNRSELRSYNIRNQLTFSRTFGNHDVNAVGGMEISNRTLKTFGSPTAYGYNDNTLTLGTFPNGPGGTFFPLKDWMGNNQVFNYTNSFTYATDRYYSWFGNLAYTFLDKYTVSGSARTDASNLISDDPGYRYSPFWSAGAGWQLSKESFLEQVYWIDRLALRATYGYNGNVDKSTTFMPLISLNPTPDIYTQQYTAGISSFGNPTLRWEKVSTINLGIDYALFGGRLFGKLDAYRKMGKDLIASISIPSVDGTTRQKFNNAKMLNKGIEMEIGSALNILGNKIRWRGNLSFAYNYNKITNLFVANNLPNDLANGGTSAYVQGKNSNTLWAYQYAGIYNQGTDAVPNWQPMIKGGDDKTRYPLSSYPTGNPLTYMAAMGTTVAPYVAGLSSEFSIYDFNLSFIITGKFGHVFRHNSFNYPILWNGKVLPDARLSEVLNGDPMKIVPLPQNANELSYYFWSNITSYMDYLTDNAAIVRMQEINLTYNVPGGWLSGKGISHAQLYAQANNLFIITANKYHEDPEYPLGTIRPQPKFTFGFKLTF